MSYLEISYLSPISNYDYSRDGFEYKLVFLSKTIHGYSNIIWEIKVSNIDNISEKIRAFPIAIALNIPKNMGKYISVILFRFDKINNILSLLFSGIIDTYSQNGVYRTMLFSPSPILGKIRSIKTKGNKHIEYYFNEGFHRFINNNKSQGCLLISYLTDLPTVKILKGNLYYPQSKKRYIINRYNSFNFIEYYLHNIYYSNELNYSFNQIIKIYKDNLEYCKKIEEVYKHTPAHKFVTDFMIDVTEYTFNLNKWKKYDDVVLRHINIKNRPLYHETNKNNIIITPVDGRVLMINNKDSIKILRSLFKIDKMLDKNNKLNLNILRGSGFICRITPQDDRGVYMPYDGYITKIIKLKNAIAFKIVNNYFMPPYVLERDQWSVVYGKCLHNNRGCDERLQEQPHIIYVMYVIITGYGYDLIRYIDKKIYELSNNNINNVKINIEKGAKLGILGLNATNIICLSNRGINFTKMLSIQTNIPLPKYREHYIRARDFVGYIL